MGSPSGARSNVPVAEDNRENSHKKQLTPRGRCYRASPHRFAAAALGAKAPNTSAVLGMRIPPKPRAQNEPTPEPKRKREPSELPVAASPNRSAL
jgi:hypothetical protein